MTKLQCTHHKEVSQQDILEGELGELAEDVVERGRRERVEAVRRRHRLSVHHSAHLLYITYMFIEIISLELILHN